MATRSRRATQLMEIWFSMVEEPAICSVLTIHRCKPVREGRMSVIQHIAALGPIPATGLAAPHASAESKNHSARSENDNNDRKTRSPKAPTRGRELNMRFFCEEAPMCSNHQSKALWSCAGSHFKIYWRGERYLCRVFIEGRCLVSPK